ncbi:MAG TPA: hypothetical protein P5560_00455 [Thermotogota bacterium]|nr:hypothetical protein [Thermotogota bacterium]HRW91403.1 hypothetical protein [Thermotogota bacterium]
MVDVNLYSKKKPRLKLLTVLILTGILVLPVAAFRITLWSLQMVEFNRLQSQYPIAAREMQSFRSSEFAAARQRLDQQERNLSAMVTRVRAETAKVEKDLVYAGTVQRVFSSFSDSFSQTGNGEKVFLNRMAVSRGSTMDMSYYDIPFAEESTQTLSLSFDFHQSFMESLLKTFPAPDADAQEINFLFLNALYNQLSLDLKGM